MLYCIYCLPSLSMAWRRLSIASYKACSCFMGSPLSKYCDSYFFAFVEMDILQCHAPSYSRLFVGDSHVGMDDSFTAFILFSISFHLAVVIIIYFLSVLPMLMAESFVMVTSVLPLLANVSYSTLVMISFCFVFLHFFFCGQAKAMMDKSNSIGRSIFFIR